MCSVIASFGWVWSSSLGGCGYQAWVGVVLKLGWVWSSSLGGCGHPAGNVVLQFIALFGINFSSLTSLIQKSITDCPQLPSLLKFVVNIQRPSSLRERQGLKKRRSQTLKECTDSMGGAGLYECHSMTHAHLPLDYSILSHF